MKQALCWIPLETWVEVFSFPWIKREELAKIVHRFKNRKFAEFLQFYLHDWGKHGIKEFTIDKDGLYIYRQQAVGWLQRLRRINLALPQTPLPGNIKSFERITISHFNAQTITFFRLIQPLLMDVNLVLYPAALQCLEQMRTVCTHLVPLLDGIHSLTCSVFALPMLAQLFPAKLANCKVLKLEYHLNYFISTVRRANETDPELQARVPEFVNLVMDWLTAPQQDPSDEPKLFEALMVGDFGFSQQLSAAIQKQFRAAKTPSTFVVLFHLPIAEFHLHNGLGEQLHGVRVGENTSFWEPKFQITRHQASNDEGKLQEWVNQNANERRCRQICMYNPTIGQIDAPNTEKADQGPSTSKKARIS